jgi:hypothetical protein
MWSYIESGAMAFVDVFHNFISNYTCEIVDHCNTSYRMHLEMPGAVNYPHEAYHNDGFWSSVQSVYALFLVCSLTYTLATSVAMLVEEKENKVFYGTRWHPTVVKYHGVSELGMRMMGLRDDSHALSWIAIFTCFYLACT